LVRILISGSNPSNTSLPLEELGVDLGKLEFSLMLYFINYIDQLNDREVNERCEHQGFGVFEFQAFI
jgi:hypothetical protein